MTTGSPFILVILSRDMSSGFNGHFIVSNSNKNYNTISNNNNNFSCPGIARRQCGGPAGQPAVWSIPDLSDCVSKWALDMNDMVCYYYRNFLSLTMKNMSI